MKPGYYILRRGDWERVARNTYAGWKGQRSLVGPNGKEPITMQADVPPVVHVITASGMDMDAKVRHALRGKFSIQDFLKSGKVLVIDMEKAVQLRDEYRKAHPEISVWLDESHTLKPQSDK